jgi:nucleoside-diphosphate-sugar epimerase
VLGAHGFIGRRLVTALRAAGHDVYAPERGTADLFGRPLGKVFYCIGLTADFRSRPYDTMRAHVSILAAVLERSDFESLVYLSSTRVYSHSSVGSEDSVLAVDTADPNDLFNVSKLAGELLCRSSGRPAVKIARLSNVVGFAPDSRNFLYALVSEALSGRITLQSDPLSAKDYISLDDTVALLMRIAEGNNDLYNIASGINVRHQEIVDRLVALTGCELRIVDRAPLFDFPLIDVSRIRTEFSYAPDVGVLDILPEFVAAFRQWQESSEMTTDSARGSH